MLILTLLLYILNINTNYLILNLIILLTVVLNITVSEKSYATMGAPNCPVMPDLRHGEGEAR